MYYTTDPDVRAKFIIGLLRLAEFLDVNPDVPVPLFGTTITLIADLAEHGGVEQIQVLAALLSAPFSISSSRAETSREFGLITYEAIANSDSAMAAHNALYSYRGSVISGD